VDFLKVGSYEGKWDMLIHKCLYSEKPLIISAGLLTIDELDKILKKAPLSKTGIKKITILHCNSNYPAEPEDCKMYLFEDLKVLERQYPKLHISLGWSDHTVCPGVIYSAVGHGAEMIEFHLDLDGEGNEFKHDHCWLPLNIANVISIVQTQMVRSNLFFSGDDHPNSKLRALMTNPKTGRRPY
jgi:N-acetylneuraminate synthase